MLYNVVYQRDCLNIYVELAINKNHANTGIA